MPDQSADPKTSLKRPAHAGAESSSPAADGAPEDLPAPLTAEQEEKLRGGLRNGGGDPRIATN